jgi:hypothetical protein
MIRVRVPALTAAAIGALGLASAQAQGVSRPPARGGAQSVNCDVIAANPNAGMDKASCEAMLHAQQSYEAAQTDPGASHPGDAAMSCEDIKAEFMQQPIQRPDPQHVAAAQAATRDYMAKSAQIQAEASAMAATSSAENLAASAVSAANPIAGRAAEAAAAAHQQAAQATLNAQAKAELQPRYRTMMAGDTAMMSDMTAQLDTNPRIARLVQLANEKHCRGW